MGKRGRRGRGEGGRLLEEKSREGEEGVGGAENSFGNHFRESRVPPPPPLDTYQVKSPLPPPPPLPP